MWYAIQVIISGPANEETGFDVPNETTVKAMLEPRRMLNDPNTRYYTLEEALEELKR